MYDIFILINYLIGVCLSLLRRWELMCGYGINRMGFLWNTTFFTIQPCQWSNTVSSHEWWSIFPKCLQCNSSLSIFFWSPVLKDFMKTTGSFTRRGILTYLGQIILFNIKESSEWIKYVPNQKCTSRNCFGTLDPHLFST